MPGLYPEAGLVASCAMTPNHGLCCPGTTPLSPPCGCHSCLRTPCYRHSRRGCGSPPDPSRACPRGAPPINWQRMKPGAPGYSPLNFPHNPTPKTGSNGRPRSWEDSPPGSPWDTHCPPSSTRACPPQEAALVEVPCAVTPRWSPSPPVRPPRSLLLKEQPRRSSPRRGCNPCIQTHVHHNRTHELTGIHRLGRGRKWVRQEPIRRRRRTRRARCQSAPHGLPLCRPR